MGFSHTASRTRASFDDPNPVLCAGLGRAAIGPDPPACPRRGPFATVLIHCARDTAPMTAWPVVVPVSTMVRAALGGGWACCRFARPAVPAPGQGRAGWRPGQAHHRHSPADDTSEAGSAHRVEQVVEQHQLGERQRFTALTLPDGAEGAGRIALLADK
jgi:hypothetical protein